MPRGMPQIEVTFNVDANGILQVAAAEKSSGKSETITIKAEKGRLSDEEIERMVQEAEKFKDEDKMYAEKVEARNSFESYEALSEEDKGALKEAIDSALAWLDDNSSAEKDEFDARRKEVEGVAIPILQKAKGGASPQRDEDEKADGPTVEEVD
ncbi:MAG: hypothetical protein SGPRY_008211 [Prymnesium sp.]